MTWPGRSHSLYFALLFPLCKQALGIFPAFLSFLINYKHVHLKFGQTLVFFFSQIHGSTGYVVPLNIDLQ